ncbi:MAG TPA: FAD-dependent oxidoreductase [Pseudomonadales bacterium]|nr:FAD-dependent oxidoreductase [Pseudomonadales bacterium]
MPIDRRTFMTSLGTALTLGASPALLSGCVAPAARARNFTPSGMPLRRVRVADDRIIRTVVGLRPFRPSGFRVAAERFGDKTLVHNYGHGGGGWTLSWGTAHLAMELASETGRREAAVLGCGIVGLTTARMLQRHGWDVTIYARELPPDTTSNIAGGQWSPASVYDEEMMTPEFRAQFDRALRLSYRYFQELVGPRYGVRWISNYILRDAPADPADDMRVELRDVYPQLRDLRPDQHPFPVSHAQHFDTMLMEPHFFLPAIIEDFRRAGGRIEVRAFASPEEVATLAQPVIMNCTGLGAGALFGDREIMPIKGQLTILKPQAEVEYIVIRNGNYMFPRSDGILLGGTHERGNWSLEPDLEAKARIIAAHRDFFARMDDPLFRTFG